jgi:hypothetical protein
MIERGGRLRFPLEAGQGLGVFGDVIGQELEGNEATERRVLSLVHDTHAPATEFLNDAVVRNGLADHAQRCYGGSIGKSMKAVEFVVSQNG